MTNTELVPELQTHIPNRFPPEKSILLGIAELVPVEKGILLGIAELVPV
jgi:hypothetical protein